MMRSIAFVAFVSFAGLQATAAFSTPASSLANEAAVTSRLFRAPIERTNKALSSSQVSFPVLGGIKKQMRHALALTSVALVWRCAPVPHAFAKTRTAPVVERNDSHKTSDRVMPAAASVLIATGSGIFLAQNLHRSKQETLESMEESLRSSKTDELDDPDRLQQARTFVENSLQRIGHQQAKPKPPSTTIPEATGSYLDQLKPNTQASAGTETAAKSSSYVDRLNTNPQKTQPKSTVKVTSYLDNLSQVFKNSNGSPKESTAPSNKMPLEPIVAKSKPSENEAESSRGEEPSTTSFVTETLDRAKELSAVGLTRTTRPAPAPGVSTMEPAVAASTATKSRAMPDSTDIEGLLRKNVPAFSPRTFREETKALVASFSPKRVDKRLSRKYAAIDSLEERAFTILADLGMVELHDDPDSPDYDHTMDNVFVE